MKTKAALILACGVLIGGLATYAASQPDPAKGPGGFSKKQLAEMIAQQGGPREQHKMLDPFVGDFEVESSFSMGPGMPPMVGKSTMKGEWVLGKRFVRSTGTPAAGEELPIESINYFGFDTRKNKYFWWGMDTMGTYGVFAEGDYDAATKTFTLLGENEEPGIGKMTFKTVIECPNNDHRTFQIWFKAPEGAPVPEGVAGKDGWFRVVELKINRKA